MLIVGPYDRAGFERIYLEPVAAEDSNVERRGKEWLGRWKRVAT